MNKLRFVCLLLLCALLAASPALAKDAKAAGSAKKQAAAKDKPAGIAARVGSEVITEAQLEEVLSRLPAKNRPPDAKRRILQDLVEIYAFAQEARRTGVANDPEVQKAIKDSTTLILAKSFYSKEIVEKATVSDEMARKEYDKRKEGYVAPEQLKVQHILVKDKDTAEKVLARLKKGESFDELAKTESKDQMSASKGGDIGWQSVTSLDPNFVKAALALKKGELSAPVQTRFGYHIIKMGDLKAKRQLSFDEVKNPLKESLKRQEVDRLRKEYVGKIKVQIFLPEDKPAAAPAQPDEAAGEPEMKPGTKPETKPMTGGVTNAAPAEPAK